MSREELEAKFKTLASSRVIPGEQAEKAVDLIRNLDLLNLVEELSSLLGKAEGPIPTTDLTASWRGSLPTAPGSSLLRRRSPS